MGQLKIRFVGICTNFRQSANPPLPVLHRVVLVNASEGKTIGGQPIPPHFASMLWLSADGEPGPEIPLTGCTLKVRNPTGSECIYEAPYDLQPNLTSLMQDRGQPLGAPSWPVINGQDPALAACYFDVDSGTFSACANIGAMSTLLTIETDGPPILDQILFGSQEIQEITVPEGMTLVVQNISTDEENSEHHFYLNYLTAHFVPLDPALPLSTPILMPSCSEVGSEVGGPLTGAGPGCSDSNYP